MRMATIAEGDSVRISSRHLKYKCATPAKPISASVTPDTKTRSEFTKCPIPMLSVGDAKTLRLGYAWDECVASIVPFESSFTATVTPRDD
jgi:hypothetical protein